MDESAYLELKGMIIDWATGQEIFLSSIKDMKKIEPEELTKMLKRYVQELEKREKKNEN